MAPDSHTPIQVELPAREAVEYARSQLWLASGMKDALGRLLESADFAAYTFAPADVEREDLLRLGSGGRGADRRAREWAVRTISEAMRAHPGSIWIVPDPLEGPPAGGLASPLVIDGNAYYVVDEADDAKIDQAWEDAVTAGGELGVLTPAELPRDGTADAFLDVAGRDAILLAMSAYDHEGVLVLKRR